MSSLTREITGVVLVLSEKPSLIPGLSQRDPLLIREILHLIREILPLIREILPLIIDPVGIFLMLPFLHHSNLLDIHFCGVDFGVQ